jgi:hypothetical protein
MEPVMTALPLCLVIAAGVGTTMTSFLGRAVIEQNRALLEAAAERAAWRATGEIELAKNVIQASTFTEGLNDAIADALASDPPLIAGTPVMVEATGAGRWYRLSSTSDFGRGVGTATCMIRDGLSYAAYNYYVEQHNLGVSGQPKGRIHSNQKLEFYFAGGAYDGYVSAGKGFAWLSGATEQNTKFLKGVDSAAEQKSLLSKVNYAELKQGAAYVAPVGLVAELSFNRKQVQIKLFEKDSVQKVPVNKTRQVVSHYVTQTVTKTKYRTEYQWVNTKKSRKVWVENNGSSAGGGTDVAGGATGYWKTEYYYELVWTKVNVADGTYTVKEQVPVYKTEAYVEYVNQTVAGKHVRTDVRDVSGIFYFPDTIRAIGGLVNGKATVVSESSVKITSSIQYVDGNNRYAYLNGTNPANGAYASNPEFERNHAFGIIAKGDIQYGLGAPASLELNGNLISTGGTVAMEGIVLAADGTPSRTGSASVKTSLRRFGSIMCSKRPVATLLDAASNVSHGFRAGSSVYDDRALNDPPPGFPNEEALAFLETVRVDSGGWRDPGGIEPQAGVAALTGLQGFDAIREATTSDRFDWGITDLKECLHKAAQSSGSPNVPTVDLRTDLGGVGNSGTGSIDPKNGASGNSGNHSAGGTGNGKKGS